MFAQIVTATAFGVFLGGGALLCIVGLLRAWSRSETTAKRLDDWLDG